jgi:predicted permease
MTPNAHEFLGRLKALLSKGSTDREISEELAFHQAMLREKLLREGIPAAEIDLTTRRTFGNPTRWHERLREVRQFRLLESLSRDIAFSVRLLRKSPGFTAIALLTLAIGVGANTAIFSLINGLLLRPLAVPDSQQLLVLNMNQGGKPQYSYPYPFFRALEQKHELFSEVFAFDHSKLQVLGRSGKESVDGQMVSGQFFSTLRTPPLLGRTLTVQDDRTGGDPAGLAAVISETFWENWFGRSPDVLGSKLQIDNTVFTVVGVMPKTFIGANPTQRPSIFVPLSAEPIINNPQSLIEDGHHAWWLTVMARPQPGMSIAKINAALLPMSMPILNDTVPDAGWVTRAAKNHFYFGAEPGSKGFTYIRSTFRKPLTAVFAMCGGILLLACLNLASLLMARGAARERELATRLAMGATRSRLIQQLLVESLLIAVIGTGIALMVAPVLSQALATMLMVGDPLGLHIDTSLDMRVVLFAVLIVIVSTLLIGLVPALQATSGNLNHSIKDGQHATRAHERRRTMPRFILSAEVCLALLLVVGAGLLSTSLIRLYKSGAGFDPQGVVNIAFRADKQALDGDALVRLYRQIGEGLRHQPGVRNVSFAFIVPMTHFVWDEDHSAPGGTPHDLYMNAVAPGYFEAMRIPVLKGRDFLWADTPSTGLKVVLNQSAANLLFPGQNPLGQHILREPKKTSFEVVAVVGDAKYEDLRTPAPPAAYIPITQNEEKKPSYAAVLRMDGPAGPISQAARSLASQLAPDMPPPVTTTMNSVMQDSLSTERVMALLSTFFAACALLVTGIGLYGTLAYATARRTSEIGIRMALGARRLQVVSLVFRENAILAMAGVLAGVVAALLSSRALESFLYSTSARDPLVLAGAACTLAAIASTASLLPALRAARIEPMAAIRCE